MASTGIIAGIILKVGTDIIAIYTLWLLVILFQHRKQIMIFIVISVLGSGIVQIVASSSSQYAINKKYNKRTWSFIFGPVISLFAFLPTARSNRLLNVVGLAGTNYSCLYFFVQACSKGIDHSKVLLSPPGVQRFFTGAAVMAGGSGSFNAVMEVTDSMRQSRKMDFAFLLAVFWIMLLVIPHTTAVVLAYPHQVLQQANIYSILPPSGWRTASVYIMLIHNIAAFTLHVQPLMFLWERFVHTQGLPYYFRLPSRLPMVGVIFLLALAIPFYGVLNSLSSALTDPSLAYFLPCLAFTLFYWKKERLKSLAEEIHTFHWFAKCYQCAGST
ncbi:hypothetical protein WJX75_000512 [Coccomyxa subellipsoidea]|uniref:Amino acid transporter transmembrane domain-containing protein n=1 Tax=Coccomyxa subellipsoidea TaxID=248742 RepID=A0ABR2Z2X9_9CHLO